LFCTPGRRLDAYISSWLLEHDMENAIAFNCYTCLACQGLGCVPVWDEHLSLQQHSRPFGIVCALRMAFCVTPTPVCPPLLLLLLQHKELETRLRELERAKEAVNSRADQLGQELLRLDEAVVAAEERRKGLRKQLAQVRGGGDLLLDNAVLVSCCHNKDPSPVPLPPYLIT
jgi:hypothetical protein